MCLMKLSLQVGNNGVKEKKKAQWIDHTRLRVLLGHSDGHLPAQIKAFHNMILHFTALQSYLRNLI